MHFVVYWTLKENPLGKKRAQDKSQKKGMVWELMHRGGTGLERKKLTNPTVPFENSVRDGRVVSR